MKQAAITVLAASFLVSLPGCVVWDIRNEMRRTNAQVGAVQQSLAATNERLDGVDTRLSGTNERLQGTNTSLSTVEEQLQLLREISASMGKLDAHLASLRKSIGAINSMMPFMDIGGDPVIETVEAAPAEPGAEQPSAQPSAQTAVQPAPAKREVLVGLWVSAYPESARAMIISPDGRYTLAKPDAKGKSTQVERGTWKRGDGTLTFQPDLVKIMAPPLPLMNASARSFALQEGEQLWVYTRP